MTLSLKMALRSIGSNKLRAILTMLGIIIGVMALVVLVSLVSGATSSVTDTISGLGSNLLTVSIEEDKGKPIDTETLETWLDEEEALGLIAPYISDTAQGSGSEGSGSVTVSTSPSCAFCRKNSRRRVLKRCSRARRRRASTAPPPSTMTSRACSCSWAAG